MLSWYNSLNSVDMNANKTTAVQLSYCTMFFFFKVHWITCNVFTAELLEPLQWRSGTWSPSLCMRQQAYGHWYTFQPRIPLEPFPCECYYSDLQYGGGDVDCGSCRLPCRTHRQWSQEICTRRHWRWNTNDYSSRHMHLPRGYQQSKHGWQCLWNSSWIQNSTEIIAIIS